METSGRGVLYVVSTPIGNLEDVTLRALRVLREADLIAAEDTRRTRRLLSAYDIHTPLTSLFAHNEPHKGPRLIERILAGQTVALVSDAGTPAVSDPGPHLVGLAIAAGVPVVPVPGASALLAALSVSGLSLDGFVFAGFLPARPARRRQILRDLREERRTLVFFAPPRRLGAVLSEMAEILGDRQASLSRELTKLHEETLRGTLASLAGVYAGRDPQGEVTLAVAGQTEAPVVPSGQALREAAERLRPEGLSRRDLAARLAREWHVSRREAYAAIHGGEDGGTRPGPPAGLAGESAGAFRGKQGQGAYRRRRRPGRNER